MSSERTGYALGRLNPIVYYQNSAGHIILPPTTETARWFLEQKGRAGTSLSDRGYMLKEAETLPEVYDLQDRMVKQEQAEMKAASEREDVVLESKWKETGDRLYRRMISDATSPMEKEVIRIWLSQRDDKRRKHLAKWQEYTNYLWAAEMDSSTKPTDRMKSEPGDKWEDTGR